MIIIPAWAFLLMLCILGNSKETEEEPEEYPEYYM